jgi:hypothetical protein
MKESGIEVYLMFSSVAFGASFCYKDGLFIECNKGGVLPT